MKDRIEFTQADLLSLQQEKIDFLNEEYNKLYETFDNSKRKTTVDMVKLTESRERYLKEHGDIKRIKELYNMFSDDTTETKPKATKSTRSTNKSTDA